MQTLHHLAQRLGNIERRFGRTIDQQHTELVTSKPGQRIPVTQAMRQVPAKLTQQLITRRMATGIIDQLELIQIEKHQAMAPALTAVLVEHSLQAALKLTAVDQTGQRIVGSLPRQIGDVLLLLGHVMQHQHRTADHAFGVDRRPDQRDRHRAAIKPLDQLAVGAAAFEVAGDDLLDQRRLVLLIVFIQQIEQCRQRKPAGLGTFPVSQALGGGVHVNDGAGHIDGDYAVANGLQRDLSALFLQLQGIGKHPPLNDQTAHPQQRQKDQYHGGDQIDRYQQVEDQPGAFAQRIAERARSRRYAFIDDIDLLAPLIDLGGAHSALTDPFMNMPRKLIELHEVAVTHFPEVNDLLHETEVVEIQVHPDDAVYVIRVIAALNDSTSGIGQRRVGLIKGFA